MNPDKVTTAKTQTGIGTKRKFPLAHQRNPGAKPLIGEPESFIRPISKGKKVVMLSLPNEVATLQTYVVSWQHTASPLVNDFFDHCREIRDR
jgi:hypothetical protein